MKDMLCAVPQVSSYVIETTSQQTANDDAAHITLQGFVHCQNVRRLALFRLSPVRTQQRSSADFHGTQKSPQNYVRLSCTEFYQNGMTNVEIANTDSLRP